MQQQLQKIYPAPPLLDPALRAAASPCPTPASLPLPSTIRNREACRMLDLGLCTASASVCTCSRHPWRLLLASTCLSTGGEPAERWSRPYSLWLHLNAASLPNQPIRLLAFRVLTGGEPAECWTLAFDHCIPGYTSRNRLPRAVVYNEQRVGVGSASL